MKTIVCKKLIIFLSLLVFISEIGIAFASERKIPSTPEIRDYTILFNGDYLKCSALVLDARTLEEKKKNLAEKKLAGDVIVLVHGQQQRPKSEFGFSSQVALRSKSGILIIPVSDTPFGKDERWRSDQGKNVVLMEIVRFVLMAKGIYVDGYVPITDKEVILNSTEIHEQEMLQMHMIPAKLTIMGWSHGAVLARRFVNAYPNSCNNMIQLSPAGYVKWGTTKFTSSACLFTYFFTETINISTGAVRGELIQALDAGWGIASGTALDTIRSFSSCLWGNTNPRKLFRAYGDIADCAVYADDSNYPVPNLKNIVVIFAKDDMVFDPDRILGDFNKAENIEKFWKTYFPKSANANTKTSLRVLPGNHIGISVYPDIYIETLLKDSDQLKF